MGDRLVHEETPMVFFKEQLDKAMEHQKVSTTAFTEWYLVNLLTGCVGVALQPANEAGYDDTPLGVLYLRALHSSRHERLRLLRSMGDSALFVSGFFAESLDHKLADLGYYRTMGGRAYARLGDEMEPVFGPALFRELAERFLEFADLLAEVSETSRLTNNASLVRLYERWAQTGSRRAAVLLAERGITPVSPGQSRPQ